mgnify:CR=1 FL=1
MTTDKHPDYIIVGAGSAGCVLAARLAEDADVRVLVLEAGPRDRDPMIHIPVGIGPMHKKRSHDWGYDFEPDPGLDGRRIEALRGRVLGGHGGGEQDGAQGGERVAVDDEAEGRVAVLRHEPLHDGHAAVQGADVLAPWRVGHDELRGEAAPLRLLPRYHPLADAPHPARTHEANPCGARLARAARVELARARPPPLLGDVR